MTGTEKIPFIITIDTEGDNLWSKPVSIETKNVKGLYRFQELCNSYGYKPVYLTNYEMAGDDEFVKFGSKFADEGACEIGMHLHAWNSPPEYKLSDDDFSQQPYLIEYPSEIIEQKVDFMTKYLQDRFQRKIVSHRAGRWGMDPVYMKCLVKHGYLVDCTVTPSVDWRKTKGLTGGKGGTNYLGFPHEPYYPAAGNIKKRDTSGKQTLLEVPMTIRAFPRKKILEPMNALESRLPAGLHRYIYKKTWLRPGITNLNAMKCLVDKEISRGCRHLEFMIHSSELSPYLNPSFPTDADIERLYDILKELFEYLSKFCYGSTLNEFYLDEQRNFDDR